MACKIVLVVVSLSVLAFFLCLGKQIIHGFVVLWKVLLSLFSSNGMILEFAPATAGAGPQCMYKTHPYYHGRCETDYDYDNDNWRSACKKYEAPKYMGGMCHDKQSFCYTC